MVVGLPRRDISMIRSQWLTMDRQDFKALVEVKNPTPPVAVFLGFFHAEEVINV